MRTDPGPACPPGSGTAGSAALGSGAPGSAREEAEHLVASVLAFATAAARGFGPHRSGPGTRQPGAGEPPAGFATGTAECCVCPVCRTIAALRDPDPELAGRVATGAGDLAAGLAGLLRSFGRPAPRAGGGQQPGAGSGAGEEQGTAGGSGREADAGADRDTAGRDTVGPGVAAASGQGDHPGARTERARGGPWPWSEFTWPRADAWDDPDDPWRAATRGTGPPPAAEPAEATEPPPAAKPMAKKAVKPKVATPPQAPSAE